MVPSFFLETGCLMKARSFSSMLKNMEMALRIEKCQFLQIKRFISIMFRSILRSVSNQVKRQHMRVQPPK